MKKIVFTEKHQQFIINSFQKGLSCNKISKQLNVYNESISNFLRNKGFNTKIRQNHYFGKGLLKDKTNEIIKLYQQGKSMQEIANYFKCSTRSLKLILAKNNIQIRKKGQQYLKNENFFKEINNPENSYFLGLFYADGCNVSKYHRIQIGMIDLDIIEKFKNALQYTGPIYKVLPKKNTHNIFYRLHLSSKKLSDDLGKWGCTQNKSCVIKFPNNISDNLMPHFLRGILDGDGSILRKEGNNWIVQIVGTHNICLEIRKYLGYGSIYVNSKNLKTNYKTYSWVICNQQIIKTFLNYIYKDATIYLNRKFAKYQEFLNSINPTNH